MQINVKSFLHQEVNEERLSKLFYNMSFTMKYIHSADYYIDQFDLSSIHIENSDTLGPINYTKLKKIPYSEKDELVYQNIFVLALLQVGVYSNTLSFLNSQFVCDNFDEFVQFLPPRDVPYLRGVIEKRNPVYYSDYIDEVNKYDMRKMQEDADMNTEGGYGVTKSKKTAIGSAMTDKETQKLYRNLDENQAAFTNFLILPLAMILLGLVFSVIVLFLQ